VAFFGNFGDIELPVFVNKHSDFIASNF